MVLFNSWENWPASGALTQDPIPPIPEINDPRREHALQVAFLLEEGEGTMVRGLRSGQARNLSEALGSISEGRRQALHDRFGNELNHLVSLSREADPEFFLGGLYAVGRRLERRRETALAGQIYQIVRGEETNPSGIAVQAHDRLELFAGRGSFSGRAGMFVGELGHTMTDLSLIAAMPVGGIFYRGARFASLTRMVGAGRAGLGARGLASLAGLGAETLAFTATGKGVRSLMGYREDWSPLHFGREAGETLVVLSGLRLAGLGTRSLYRAVYGKRMTAAARAMMPVYETAGTYLGILGSHGLLAEVGLRDRMPLSALMAQSAGFLVHFKAGAYVARRLTNPYLGPLERSLDLRIQALEGTQRPMLEGLSTYLSRFHPRNLLKSWGPQGELVPADGPGPDFMDRAPGEEMGHLLMSQNLKPFQGSGGRSSASHPTFPPPHQIEKLTEKYLNRSPAPLPYYTKDIIRMALTTRGNQANFHERLLEAYSQSPHWGMIEGLYQALALNDLFHYDALDSPLGSWKASLLQFFVRRNLAEESQARRDAAFGVLFHQMELGMTERGLSKLFQEYGYNRGLELDPKPVYSKEYQKVHERTIQEEWASLRSEDRVTLLNLVQHWAPYDLVKGYRLIQGIGRAHASGRYPPGLIEAVLEQARRHPMGNRILERLVQVLMVGDLPGKLQEMLDPSASSDTIRVVRKLQESGLNSEAMAKTIQGTSHTAHLEDTRLSRKVVSVALDVAGYLQENHPGRRSNYQALSQEILKRVRSSQKLTLEDYVDFLAITSPLQAETLRQMLDQQEVDVRFLPEKDFHRESSRYALPSTAPIFFAPPIRPGQKPKVFFQEIPRSFFEPGMEKKAQERVFNHLQGLIHEMLVHARQATGKEESLAGGLPAFDFTQMGRHDRMVSEMMAFLEEERWLAKNYSIEDWQVAKRLGQTPAQYYRDLNDHNYYSEKNQKRLNQVRE